MIKAVIFDMDGLMFDTESLFSEVQDKIAGKRGKKFTNGIKHKMMGQKAIDAISIMLSELKINENPEDVFKEQNEDYLELLKTKAEPMPGLFDLLDYLEKNNIRKAVATSSLKEWVDILFNRFNLYKRFEAVVTGDMVKKGKPDPEIYQKAVKLLNLEPSECVIIEDGLNGIRSGKSTGCLAIAVPSYFTKGQDFSEADVVVDGLEDKRLYNFIMK